MADKRLVEYLKMHGLTEHAPERLETAMFAAPPNELQKALLNALKEIDVLVADRERLALALVEAQQQAEALMALQASEHGA